MWKITKISRFEVIFSTNRKQLYPGSTTIVSSAVAALHWYAACLPDVGPSLPKWKKLCNIRRGGESNDAKHHPQTNKRQFAKLLTQKCDLTCKRRAFVDVLLKYKICFAFKDKLHHLPSRHLTAAGEAKLFFVVTPAAEEAVWADMSQSDTFVSSQCNHSQNIQTLPNSTTANAQQST